MEVIVGSPVRLVVRVRETVQLCVLVCGRRRVVVLELEKETEREGVGGNEGLRVPEGDGVQVGVRVESMVGLRLALRDTVLKVAETAEVPEEVEEKDSVGVTVSVDERDVQERLLLCECEPLGLGMQEPDGEREVLRLGLPLKEIVV